eukprot:GHUV01019878.1.p1 GENE.GHUV01019878.1~~GHUV01019878.1.p1  ORF type:complete len:519 (+),score=206.36 GHUV01019878.1:133-1689(+)
MVLQMMMIMLFSCSQHILDLLQTQGIECKLGANCPHSHNVFESWLHPQKYRTMMCKDRDKCTRPVCFFAHGPHELRTPTDPTPLPQQMDVAAAAAATAAHAMPGQGSNVAALAAAAAAGTAVGSSMQNWQLMQNQIAQLAQAGTAFNTLSNSFGASGFAQAAGASPSAGFYMGPMASAAVTSPQATGLRRAGSSGFNSSTGGLNAAAAGTMFGPTSSSYANGLVELSANEQLARFIQQASNPAGACLPPQRGLPVQQLVNSLAQQVNVSRQEAQHSRDAAALAQQQLMAMTAALDLQGAGSASSSTALPVVSMPQQLRMGSACGSNNLDVMVDGSDLSSNIAYMDGSSGTLPDITGSTPTQQQMFTAAAAGNNAWRSDREGLVFMPDLSRSASTGASLPMAGMAGHPQMGTAGGSASALVDSQGSYGSGISLAAPGQAPAPLNQQQQLRQAFGTAGIAAGGVVPGQQTLLFGASAGQLGQLNALQQQHMQILQQGVQQASGAIPVSTTATSSAVMYLM